MCRWRDFHGTKYFTLPPRQALSGAKCANLYRKWTWLPCFCRFPVQVNSGNYKREKFISFFWITTGTPSHYKNVPVKKLQRVGFSVIINSKKIWTWIPLEPTIFYLRVLLESAGKRRQIQNQGAEKMREKLWTGLLRALVWRVCNVHRNPCQIIKLRVIEATC